MLGLPALHKLARKYNLKSYPKKYIKSLRRRKIKMPIPKMLKQKMAKEKKARTKRMISRKKIKRTRREKTKIKNQQKRKKKTISSVMMIPPQLPNQPQNLNQSQ